MKKVFTLLFIFSFSFVFSQNIPTHRITDWTNPGVEAVFTNFTLVNFSDYQPDVTGATDCSPLLTQLLQDYNSPIKIVFPAGKFLFSSRITLRDSVILEGTTDELQGNLSTILLGEQENQGIYITGTEVNLTISIAEELKIGKKRIAKVNGWNPAVGDIIRLIPNDEAQLITSAWAEKTTGQIIKIVQVDADSITFDKPLRRDYDAAFSVHVFLQNPINQVHISCVNVEKLHQSTAQTSNIYLRNARNCSVKGVNSFKTNYAHIVVYQSSNISIENNFFHDSFSFGTGGQGYGVVLLYATGNSFVHANIFKKLRHSMLLQAGANGNVLAYNYSYDVYWEDVSLPVDAAGDLCLHGNYPYMNLFEGNVAQNMVIDASHGINGKYNTFFRNRAENYGLFMATDIISDEQNIIGNQFPNMDNFKGLYIIQGQNVFQYGNNVRGALKPAGTIEPTMQSLFDYSFGSFYTHKAQIPPITTGNTQQTYFNEAEYRYKMNNKKAICAMIDYSEGVTTKEEIEATIRIFPNPASHFLFVEAKDEFDFIELADISGRIIFSYTKVQGEIVLPQVPAGLYLLHLLKGNQKMVQKVLIQQ